MSKPLSWCIDDYPKLKIDHPWLKNAIENLEKEIKRLEAALKEPFCPICGKVLEYPNPGIAEGKEAAAKIVGVVKEIEGEHIRTTIIAAIRGSINDQAKTKQSNIPLEYGID